MELDENISPGTDDTPPAVPRFSAFRAVGWTSWDALIALAPLIVGRAVSSVIDQGDVPDAIRWGWFPINLLGMAWTLAYPLLIVRRRNPHSLRRPRGRAIAVEGLVAFLLLPVMIAVMSAAGAAVTRRAGNGAMPSPLEPFARSSYPGDRIAIAVLAILVAPISEEILFRGLVYNLLRKRLSVLPAALLQAAAFGLLHPFGFVVSVATGVAGVALALVYEWRKTLLTLVLLHALLNAAAVAMMAATAAAYAAPPVLGVRGDPADGGCAVTEVGADGAADRAGLRIGDLITAVDGQPVASLEDIARIVQQKRVGETIRVEFVRDGSEHIVEATLRKRGP